jgi:two-component system, OmpR family, response regulator
MPKSEGMVMVVDDNQDVRESMLMVLELMGWNGRGFETAEEALAAFDGDGNQASYALAFVDVTLPGMSGFEMAADLRKRAAGQPEQLMLVAMTGWGAEEDREQALAAGFDEHVVKPLDMPGLERLLNSARSRG